MSESGIDPCFWIVERVNPWELHHHAVSRILARATTPHQELMIVEFGGCAKALVLDGKIQSCTIDEFIYHEALVHLACVCHGGPRSALVLGGGEGATARELLRWHTIERIRMIDIDADVVTACRTHLPELHQGAFDDPRFELVIGDALDLLDTTDTRWDIVISDLSDPIEDGPSTSLFTQETFQKVRRVLAEDGFFVVQAGPVGPIDMSLHVRLVNTIATVFDHVAPYSACVPSFGSPWGFCLASSQPIDTVPDPAVVDVLLQQKTKAGLRAFDGRTMLGLFQIPLHVRRAIELERDVYTMRSPPRA